MHSVSKHVLHDINLLADRTNGRSIGTVLRVASACRRLSSVT